MAKCHITWKSTRWQFASLLPPKNAASETWNWRYCAMPTKGCGRRTWHFVGCMCSCCYVVLFKEKTSWISAGWGGASSLFPAASNSLLWVCPEEGCCKQWILRYLAIDKGNNNMKFPFNKKSNICIYGSMMYVSIMLDQKTSWIMGRDFQHWSLIQAHFIGEIPEYCSGQHPGNASFFGYEWICDRMTSILSEPHSIPQVHWLWTWIRTRGSAASCKFWFHVLSISLYSLYYSIYLRLWGRSGRLFVTEDSVSWWTNGGVWPLRKRAFLFNASIGNPVAEWEERTETCQRGSQKGWTRKRGFSICSGIGPR